MRRLALFMALVMMVSAIPATQVKARSRHDNQGQFNELHFGVSAETDFLHEQVQSQTAVLLSPQYEHLETFDLPGSLHHEATASEARQKYDLLRAGNYTSAQVVNRFHELFGYISSDYILRNYTRIFDIISAEI